MPAPASWPLLKGIGMNEEDKLSLTTGSAVGLSAVASFIGLCCIGPWAVAFLGVSGAITMARWAPLRPYVLVVALALLAWGFWRTYGPPRKKLCAAGLCPKQPSPWLQLALWLTLAMVTLAFFAEQIQWLLIDPTPTGLRK